MGIMIRIISWNLLRLVGASLDDVARLIERHHPDLLLMQEATEVMDGLPSLLGGHYHRALLPGRVHGLAAWSPARLPAGTPSVLRLPSGAIVQRVCQILEFDAFTVANVHLSHGQVLNRRQLRRISGVLPPRAAILGDFNLVGPTFLPGFRDVGPREPTHIAGDMMPLRIDRCLARGLQCSSARALDRGASDHRPIIVELKAAAPGVSLQPAAVAAAA
jgi:endonuclease/exonuclease/phosphatase (EEP) superfamily protein YafD